MARLDPYAATAAYYESAMEPLMRSLRSIGLVLHPPERGTRVLDIGCGTGTHLRLYQKHGCSVVGLDCSPAMLRVARRTLGPQAPLHLGDGTRLPYSDGAFDLVLFSMALHEHDAAMRSRLLAEAGRVTSEAGRVLVIDFHPGPFRFPMGWARRALIIGIELLGGWEHFRNHLRFLDSGGLPAMLASHQLILDKSKVVGRGTMGIYLLQRGTR